MRYLVNLHFVPAIIISGVAAVFFTSAEQGSWSLSFPMPWASQLAVASEEPSAQNAAETPAVTVLRGQSIGDWIFTCGTNPQTSRKQCTITQQLTGKRTQSGVFAGLTSDDGADGLVAVWRTPARVLANRGAVVDVGAGSPIAAPFTSCITGRCGAVANLAPGFIDILRNSIKTTATVLAVNGEGPAFGLDVNGLAWAIDAVKAPRAG